MIVSCGMMIMGRVGGRACLRPMSLGEGMFRITDSIDSYDSYGWFVSTYSVRGTLRGTVLGI